MPADATDALRALLEALVRARATEQAAAWLDKSVAALAAAGAAAVTVTAVLNVYAGASRRMGKQALALDAAEAHRVAALDAALRLEHWGLDEAARALLLLHLPAQPAAAFVERVLACYEKGDSREQESWLRGLAVMPHAEQFRLTAVDACRTNIIPMFEAIACENPYPMRHFPERNFNQMVLKALFNSIALARIVGLAGRLNPDLARMADDYVSEREAAGRAVPADIWVVIAPHAQHAAAGALDRVHRYLEHEDKAHRYWAAVSLGTAQDEPSRDRLRKRLAQEPDAQVRGAIETTLAGPATTPGAGPLAAENPN